MNRKVIYVTSRCPFDNWEIWAIREMNSLVEAGLDLTIIPRTAKGKIIHEEALKLEERTIATPFLNLPIVFALIRKVIKQPSDFIKIIKWIISQSNSLSDFAKGLVVLPKSLFISNLLKGKEIEHVHAFSTTSVAVVAFILAHELKIPWSITFHASWVINKSHHRSIFTHLKSVSFVRAISNEVENSLTNYVGLELSRKIKILHIGVNCENTFLKNQKEDRHNFVIASAGWLLPHKGIDVSLFAAKKLIDNGITNFLWIFYGDGPLLSELSTIMKELKLEKNVIFAGAIDNKTLLNMYENGAIDLFILNSVKRNGIQEGIPVSLMEAMAYSIPVIATDCGGTIELVDENSGILINQNDSEATALAVSTLVNDKDKCISQGREGRKKILNEFNTRKIAEQLTNLFFEKQ